MSETTEIQAYINKRLAALEIIDSRPEPFSLDHGEIVVGVITNERTKKIFHLSKIISREIENLSSKLAGSKDFHKEETRLAFIEVGRLDCVQKILDAELRGSLFYDFPKIKDYVSSHFCVAVQKDWRVVVITGELLEELSEFLIKEEFKNRFIIPPGMS